MSTVPVDTANTVWINVMDDGSLRLCKLLRVRDQSTLIQMLHNDAVMEVPRKDIIKYNRKLYSVFCRKISVWNTLPPSIIGDFQQLQEVCMSCFVCAYNGLYTISVSCTCQCVLSPSIVLKDAKFKHAVGVFQEKICKEYSKYGVDSWDDEKLEANTAINIPTNGHAAFFLMESDSIHKMDLFFIAYVEMLVINGILPNNAKSYALLPQFCANSLISYYRAVQGSMHSYSLEEAFAVLYYALRTENTKAFMIAIRAGAAVEGSNLM